MKRLAIAMLFLALTASAFGQSKQDTEKWLSDFLIPHGQWINADGSMGSTILTINNCAVEERYLVFKNGNIVPPKSSDLWWKFSFADIDPETIKVVVLNEAYGSPAYVGFETTDSKSLVCIGGSSTCIAIGNINIDSVENAKRFSNALKHEVLLCGGKASTF